MILAGDCVEVLRELDDASIDAVITDPPYGLEFMGAEWDKLGDVRQPNDPTFHRSGAGPFDRAKVRHGAAPSYGDPAGVRMQAWHQAWALEVMRVLKPGGYVAAFGGTRTSHRLACAIEDAGFEIRDSIVWLFAQGFPKSLNLDGGLGTALKPAHEPVVVARKPLIGTVMQNVLEHGTGAMNIDAGRVATTDGLGGGDQNSTDRNHSEGWDRPWMHDPVALERHADRINGNVAKAEALGRWPANVALSHSEACERVGTRRVKAITGTASGRMGAGYQSSVYGGYTGNSELFGKPTGYGDEDGMELVEEWDCVEGCPVRALDEQSGLLQSGTGAVKRASAAGYESGSMAGRESRPAGTPNLEYGDAGGASRFYFCGKASRAERDAGLDEFPVVRSSRWSSGEQSPGTFQSAYSQALARGVCPYCETPLPWVSVAPRAATQAGSEVPPPRATTAPTTPQAGGSDSGMTSSGSPPTELFPVDSMSTTSTATSRTTDSTTSSSSPTSTTSESTPNASDAMPPASGSAVAGSAASGSPPPPSTSTSPERDGSPTADADPATSGSSSKPNSGAPLRCPSCGEVVEGALRNSHPT